MAEDTPTPAELARRLDRLERGADQFLSVQALDARFIDVLDRIDRVEKRLERAEAGRRALLVAVVGSLIAALGAVLGTILLAWIR